MAASLVWRAHGVLMGQSKHRKRRKVAKIRRRHAPGASPGLIAPAEDAGAPNLNVVAFGEGKFLEVAGARLPQLAAIRREHAVVWVDVAGFGDVALIESLGEAFDLHRLALEDVVHTHQRPKAEDYGDHLFLIARMLRSRTGVETEQVAFFLGKGFLLTLKEDPGDCFEPVRQRLRKGQGRIQRLGADYLLYALIDVIIDEYFPTLEQYGEIVEGLEDAVVEKPALGHVSRLHDLKRDLLDLRRAVWPHREMVNNLIRDEHALISAETRPFLRDCYDHTVQLMDIIETYREIASGLLDVYLSSTSMKLNEVMKVLTIVATVFMPLSFIASLYGMNFNRSASPWNMPELDWYFGYPLALLLMVVTAGGMIWYFWRKGWLSEKETAGRDD